MAYICVTILVYFVTDDLNQREIFMIGGKLVYVLT